MCPIVDGRPKTQSMASPPMPVTAPSAVTVMTSCSLAGWKEHGARCLDTLHRFWPAEVEVHIVSEDKLPVSAALMKQRHITVWDLLEVSPQAREFYKRHENNKRVRGIGHGLPYCFRHDAYKFSKKVFAVKVVADSLIGSQRGGRLIWLDADTVTFLSPPMELLQRMPPHGSALACLDRGKYHSECGWIAYDLSHPMAHRFITEFANLFAADAFLPLPEWHDSWVFDWLRKQMKVPAHHIPHKSVSHPFVHSELGLYMDHLKGRRKQMGASPEHPRLRRTGA